MKPEEKVLTFISFLIAMAVFGWLFRISFERPVGASISFSALPALICAGLVAWGYRRRDRRS